MPAECKGGFFAGPTIFDYVKVEIEDRPRGDFQPRSLHQRVENFEEGLEIMNENRFANDSVIYTENRACARE
jgi:malonate-semialdehyde dehydrogenase (acetylating)/methylmalonate-semialdehyde dehydrogenase